MITEIEIKELLKYFNLYGYGNFDLTLNEIVELFKILQSQNYKEQLKIFYGKLEKERMG